MPDATASPPVTPPPSQPPSTPPSHLDLFLGFAKVTLMGFGGTLPWTRRMVVEEKRWMTAEEWNESYAFCQFLPGPNIVNLTAIFGSRLHGVTGALACWAGFLALPFAFMVLIGSFYELFGDVDVLRRILRGLAAAAAGMLIATVAKMAVPLCRSVGPAPVVVVATAGAIGLMHWPLLWVMIVIVPISIAATVWVRR